MIKMTRTEELLRRQDAELLAKLRELAAKRWWRWPLKRSHTRRFEALVYRLDTVREMLRRCEAIDRMVEALDG